MYTLQIFRDALREWVTVSGSQSLYGEMRFESGLSCKSLMLPSYHWSCLPAIVRKEKQIGKESKTSCLKSILRVHCCLVAKSCPALCDPMDGSQPDSSVQGIVQARILEWVAISSSRRSFQPRDQTHIFCVSFQADSLSLSHQEALKGPSPPSKFSQYAFLQETRREGLTGPCF